MEVGPTCHYVMGGVEVDPDTGAAAVPGLFAAGECSGGMHGSNRLGGNSLSDLLVFGRRAGSGAADYVRALAAGRRSPRRPSRPRPKRALAPFEARRGTAAENPYTLHAELQQSMNDLVGIIRKEEEITRRWSARRAARSRFKNIDVEGGRAVQPGLAPGHRHAQHAAGQRMRGQGRAGAHRKPGRPHPRRPPGDGPDVAQGAAGLPRGGDDDDGARRDGDPRRPAADARRICWRSSRSPSWRSTSPTKSWPSTQDGESE